MIHSSGSESFSEVCHSVPKQTAVIERPSEITIEYTNSVGTRKTVCVSHPLSGVVHHELDHIEGKLLFYRLSNLKSSRMKRSINKMRQEIREFRESMYDMETPKTTRVSSTLHLSKAEIKKRKKMRSNSKS